MPHQYVCARCGRTFEGYRDPLHQHVFCGLRCFHLSLTTSPFLPESIIEDYRDAKMSLREVSLKYGVDKNVVKSFLLRNGVTLRPPRKLSKEVLAPPEMASDYIGGMSCKSISKKYGIDYTKVRNLLKEMGVTLRPSGGLRIWGSAKTE